MTSKIGYNVCAGWIPGDPVIGTCTVMQARGKDTVAFSYSPSWARAHPGFTLGPDVVQMAGIQYPRPGHEMFGFLSDIAPDRWGRRLMDRRERVDAKADGRTPLKLTDSDYMLGVHDGGRMGGVRLQDQETGRFLSDRAEMAAPPITRLRELQQAVHHLEVGEPDPAGAWLRTLFAPGSSLGGARPKANVIDTDGTMWIAKFPSRQDDHNVGAWEMVAHDLAQESGIAVPPARLEQVSTHGDVFLVRRFDRYLQDGQLYRRHFASAMTMLGEVDGASDRHSYLELADILERLADGGQEQAQMHELWRRMVFNICTRNADDHLRNHGFLLNSDDTWMLSPAYDLNPDPDQDRLSLLVNMDTDACQLKEALAGAEYFALTIPQATDIAGEIQKTVREHWRKLAGHYRISRQEQERFSYAFTEAYANLPGRQFYVGSDRDTAVQEGGRINKPSLGELLEKAAYRTGRTSKDAGHSCAKEGHNPGD